jgi:MoaA/NifB/PqqE/SkfB family radical SAM enzyme
MVMVIMRQNLAELPELVELAGEFGVEEVFAQQLSHDFGESSFTDRFRPLHQYVDGQTLIGAEPSWVEEIYQDARERSQQNGVKLRLPKTRPTEHPASVPGQDRCDWPWTGAYISFQGYMMPCCMVATPELVNFGLAGPGNLEEVWNGSGYQEFRYQLSSPQPPEMCKMCSIYRGIF